MFERIKSFWLPVLLALTLLVAGWSIIFGLADQLIKVNPVSATPLQQKRPKISLDFPYVPLAGVNDLKVTLDGVDITPSLTLSNTGFEFRPKQALTDGLHTVRADFDYCFIISKKMSLTWNFEIDTMPPEILFSKYDGEISSSKFWLDDLAGHSEPRAKLKVTLNTRELPEKHADETGNFKLAVYSLATNNNLKITAIDNAGNSSTKEVKVKVDLTSPLILDVFPAEGETFFGDATTITATIDDGNSEVENVSLFVDGNRVEAAYNPAKKQVSAVIPLTKDGIHKASLEIADPAGNSSRRDWSFDVNTARLVVSCSQCKIFYYREGKLVKVYPCAVGKAKYPTPKGRWRVINKRKNPSWSNPGTAWAKDMPPYIPPGPGNPLGPRAIDLSASGIRIHGTPNIGSIGRPASHGCIRMYPKDVIELFELVPVGAPVDVVP